MLIYHGRENEIKKIVKLRIISGFFDFSFFFILLNVSFGITVALMRPISTGETVHILYWFPPITIVIFYIYFGAIPYIKKGYTLFGYLFGIKIVPLKEDIRLSKYILRALFAFISPLRFLFLMRIKVNQLGQLYYDIPFDTTVVKRNTVVSYNKKAANEFFSYYFGAENIHYFFIWLFALFLLSLIVHLVGFK